MELKATRLSGPQYLLLATVYIAIFGICVYADDTVASTNTKTIKKEAIVIHTQVQTYDQPTLSEYQECQDNREKCQKVCEGASDVGACENECPTCPILISQDIVIQGINDTNHRRDAATPAGNTTNIIRLTNEIHNIIDNQMGNITARNENNIHVHQNLSSIGGEFGLGFNDNGSCCIVVRSSSNCDAAQFSTSARCHHKRHRVCGGLCTARVMYAKRVTQCSNNKNGVSKNINDTKNCQQSVVYVPYATYRKRRAAATKCHPTQQWPFVSCPKRRESHTAQQCRQCLQLPYGYILRNGIPPRCMSCYGGYNSGYSNGYAPQPVWYAPPAYIYPELYPTMGQRPVYNDDYDLQDELLPGAEGWKIEKTECRRPDGAIIENCYIENESNNTNVESGSGDDNFGLGENEKIPGDPLESLPEAQDEIFYGNNYNDHYSNGIAEYPEYDEELRGVEAVRRRRQAFRRSAYSRRNKRKNV